MDGYVPICVMGVEMCWCQPAENLAHHLEETASLVFDLQGSEPVQVNISSMLKDQKMVWLNSVLHPPRGQKGFCGRVDSEVSVTEPPQRF